MKKPILASLALALALPLSAQVGPGPGGPGPGGPPQAGAPGAPGGPAAIKDALGLSDTQMQQLQALLETRRQAMDALQAQIQAAQKALGDALAATTPDPAAVGTKLLALDALQKQGRTIGDAFKSGFEALLTPDQKTKLEALEQLGASLRALDALRSIGY